MRLLITVFLLLAGAVVPASFSQSSSSEARKIDSYNDKIPSGEAEQWHLEDFRRALEGEPDSKAYIVAYGGRDDFPGKAQRYATRARNYLVNSRGIDAQRIIAANGGRREEFVVELWLVPRTAKLPDPTPAITVDDDRGDNLQYDDIGIGYENFSSQTEDDAAWLDGFAEALKKEAGSWGCIIAYAMAGDDSSGFEWDAPDTALKIARERKRYLVNKHHLPPERVSIVDGGYSRRQVELWIMRPKARFDRGPFVYASRLKSSKPGTLTIGKSRDQTCCHACARGSAKRSEQSR